MIYRDRPYLDSRDIYDTGRLLRYAYSRSKFLNAWSVCRFDIWSHRRMNDVSEYGESNWSRHYHLWYDQSRQLAGCVFASQLHHSCNDPHPYAVILHPDHIDLAERMLDWAERQTTPEVEVIEGNSALRDLVQKRGYLRSNDFMSIREKLISGTPKDIVHLPDGFVFKILERPAWEAYFLAVQDVFGMLDTEQAFRAIQQAPSNLHDCHVNVIDKNGQIAAFCSAWLDRDNKVAEFEPVGTRSVFQKKGLASALLAHVSNRLRMMDCRMVKVEVWSESPGANNLYRAVGLIETDRSYSWKKIENPNG
jgi:ribosomal protein S18 acetylase RimI-like enzyme